MSPTTAKGKFALDYDNSHLVIYQDAACTQIVVSGVYSITPAASATFYVKGTTVSGSLRDQVVSLCYEAPNGEKFEGFEYLAAASLTNGPGPVTTVPGCATTQYCSGDWPSMPTATAAPPRMAIRSA